MRLQRSAHGAVTMKPVPSAAPSPIILAENLTKVYAAGKIQVTAVRGVSFEVDRASLWPSSGRRARASPRSFTCWAGSRGPPRAGWSSTASILPRLNDAERTRLRKHRIGFVFQKFNLLPTLSAMGNIEIAYAISGRKEPLDRKYLDHLSDMLSIQGRLEHRPSAS